MMHLTANPFPLSDPDRRTLWEMLVARDIAAFAAADWTMVEPDFAHDRFMGVDGKRSPDPDDWTISFPTLAAYRDEWLRQAHDFARVADPVAAAGDIFAATNLSVIEIAGDRAVAHKKFDGKVRLRDGSHDTLNWQTLYFAARIEGDWKLTGFVGYLPYPMGRGKA